MLKTIKEFLFGSTAKVETPAVEAVVEVAPVVVDVPATESTKAKKPTVAKSTTQKPKAKKSAKTTVKKNTSKAKKTAK